MSIAPATVTTATGDMYRPANRSLRIYVRQTGDDGRPMLFDISSRYSALPGMYKGEPFADASSLEMARDVLPHGGNLGGHGVRVADSRFPEQVTLAHGTGQALEGVLANLGEVNHELPRFARDGYGAWGRVSWGKQAADGDLLVTWKTFDPRPDEDPTAATGSFAGNLSDLPAESAKAITDAIAAWDHLSVRI